ncbi:hypothetical protein PHYBLDRAFT_143689 [Phycomyces blakesleeanus NRRL 1555(-)]|uniref:Uncharacterized protein n=1 Tax=Phycomyces blakesleeanus (strain ATCC 8743b / DSM 1359 / FGSC 10004 / NBRC 33097 / NRRL 1555) TaxID=763407 RepID=A0A162PS17_PHYB8|nr:hypothetical protein PHYBLDRAFT_143689 [Phycomyces blakesleeanus NRRL 1555(-)]OAD75447.1 hypothetical protein PHYBLDRAFT_143689 [Phycomyces blakesleeanus NRRL 1555(-)]|eukprot:XP_018293487.1 hypothetical protein PHYBLDRAFT_143689 [Phycomyces blakesleeanus NRRL 1555(-)]
MISQNTISATGTRKIRPKNVVFNLIYYIPRFHQGATPTLPKATITNTTNQLMEALCGNKKKKKRPVSASTSNGTASSSVKALYDLHISTVSKRSFLPNFHLAFSASVYTPSSP